MSKLSVRWDGVDDLSRRLGRAPERASTALAVQLNEIARTTVFPITQEQVPVDTGRLKASGQVEQVGDEVRITYGAAISDPRAIVQHERTDFNHPRGGKAKYVSDPMEQVGRQLKTLVGAKLPSTSIFGTGS